MYKQLSPWQQIIKILGVQKQENRGLIVSLRADEVVVTVDGS